MGIFINTYIYVTLLFLMFRLVWTYISWIITCNTQNNENTEQKIQNNENNEQKTQNNENTEQKSKIGERIRDPKRDQNRKSKIE